METYKKEEMTTMTSCINKLQSEGYKENFIAKETGLEAPSSKKIYIPPQVKITNFYRFEGESDPADNAIVYSIETEDGVKGILVDSYGMSANAHISRFVTEVEEIAKKEPHSENKE